MKIKTRNTLIVLTLASVLIGSVWYWSSIKNKSATNIQQTPQGIINYSPSTDADKKLNDDMKKSTQEEPSSTNSAPQSTSNKESVTPVISAWGQPLGPGTDFTINGYVPDVVESGGVCKLTLKKDGQSLTKQKGALQNVQDTSCGRFSVPFDELTAGQWSAILSYESATASGNSEVIDVEVK